MNRVSMEDSLQSAEPVTEDATSTCQPNKAGQLSNKLLTGNAEADESIRGFYAARASLLRSQSFAGQAVT